MMLRKFLSLLVLLAAVACQQLPQERWSRLHELRSRLRAEKAVHYLPNRTADFEANFEAARREVSRISGQNGVIRLCLELFYGETAAIGRNLNIQILEAETLLADSIDMRERLREAERVQIRELSNYLVRRASFDSSPKVRRVVGRMEIKLAAAQDFWNQGRYLQARDFLNDAQLLGLQLQGQVEEIRARFEDLENLNRWRKWVLETIEWSRRQGQPAIIVDKYHRLAKLYRGGRLMQQYQVDLGWNPWRDKIRQGDGATPEGRYRVEGKKGRGETRYYRALLLDYPSRLDRKIFWQARQSGRIDETERAGGLIEIHGEGGKGIDWTDGCVALDNYSMEELFNLAYVGMPVTVVGRFKK